MAAKKGKKSKMAGLDDVRFQRIRQDPVFSGLKNTQKKVFCCQLVPRVIFDIWVVIDKRFAAALTDERFSSRAKVDMRGRKTKIQTGNGMLDLYELEDNEEEKPTKEASKKGESKNLKEAMDFLEERSDEDEENDEKDEEEEEKNDDESEVEKDEDEKPRKLDLARGTGNVSSSSSDDDSSDEEDGWQPDDEMKLELDIAQIDKDAENVEWVSRRLAICHLDWQTVRCEDILVLLKSFLPDSGKIKSVSIYLSDFGKKQLDLEEKNGPPLKLKKPLDQFSESDALDSETKVAIRQYLLDRLKYFYAVVEFDEKKTASAVYDECDGFQFEESGLKMDMRFIPDDMEFAEDRLREHLNADDMNTQKYKPKKNVKPAIASTSSKIAWDEDDLQRSKKIRAAFADDHGETGKDLFASSDEEEEDGAANRRQQLLSLIDDETSNANLKVDWEDKEDDDSGNEKDDIAVDSTTKAAAKRSLQLDSDGESSDGEYAPIDEDADEVGLPVDKKTSKRRREDDEEDQEELAEDSKKKSGYKEYLVKKKAKRAERKLARRRGGNVVKPTSLKDEKVIESVVHDDRFKALFTDSAFSIEQSSKKFKGSTLAARQAGIKATRSGAEPKTTTTETEANPPSSSSEDLVAKLRKKSAKWK